MNPVHLPAPTFSKEYIAMVAEQSVKDQRTLTEQAIAERNKYNAGQMIAGYYSVKNNEVTVAKEPVKSPLVHGRSPFVHVHWTADGWVDGGKIEVVETLDF